MLLIEQAKLPPPIPESSAKAWNTQNGVPGFIKAIPVPAAGIINSAVVRKMVLRPPAMRIMNDAGMRSVAPARPASAVSENSWLTVNEKPRFCIWVVIIPHIIQTANPISRLGMDIHRLRLAMCLPSCSQNWASSTFHFSMSAFLLLMALSPWHQTYLHLAVRKQDTLEEEIGE